VRCCRPSAAGARPGRGPRLPPLAELPPGQRRVLEVVMAALEAGHNPSYKELQLALSFRSPQGVVGHVKYLRAKGWLTHGGKLSRNIALSPAARAALRGARPEGEHVLLALYAPAERLTPQQARELARALDAAAGAVEGQDGR
jgi:SOS-response transcriptional repressor LexA